MKDKDNDNEQEEILEILGISDNNNDNNLNNQEIDETKNDISDSDSDNDSDDYSEYSSKKMTRKNLSNRKGGGPRGRFSKKNTEGRMTIEQVGGRMKRGFFNYNFDVKNNYNFSQVEQIDQIYLDRNNYIDYFSAFNVNDIGFDFTKKRTGTSVGSDDKTLYFKKDVFKRKRFESLNKEFKIVPEPNRKYFLREKNMTIGNFKKTSNFEINSNGNYFLTGLQKAGHYILTETGFKQILKIDVQDSKKIKEQKLISFYNLLRGAGNTDDTLPFFYSFRNKIYQYVTGDKRNLAYLYPSPYSAIGFQKKNQQVLYKNKDAFKNTNLPMKDSLKKKLKDIAVSGKRILFFNSTPENRFDSGQLFYQLYDNNEELDIEKLITSDEFLVDLKILLGIEEVKSIQNSKNNIRKSPNQQLEPIQEKNNLLTPDEIRNFFESEMAQRLLPNLVKRIKLEDGELLQDKINSLVSEQQIIFLKTVKKTEILGNINEPEMLKQSREILTQRFKNLIESTNKNGQTTVTFVSGLTTAPGFNLEKDDSVSDKNYFQKVGNYSNFDDFSKLVNCINLTEVEKTEGEKSEGEKTEVEEYTTKLRDSIIKLIDGRIQQNPTAEPSEEISFGGGLKAKLVKCDEDLKGALVFLKSDNFDDILSNKLSLSEKDKSTIIIENDTSTPKRQKSSISFGNKMGKPTDVTVTFNENSILKVPANTASALFFTIQATELTVSYPENNLETYIKNLLGKINTSTENDNQFVDELILAVAKILMLNNSNLENDSNLNDFTKSFNDFTFHISKRGVNLKNDAPTTSFSMGEDGNVSANIIFNDSESKEDGVLVFEGIKTGKRIPVNSNKDYSNEKLALSGFYQSNLYNSPFKHNKSCKPQDTQEQVNFLYFENDYNNSDYMYAGGQKFGGFNNVILGEDKNKYRIGVFVRFGVDNMQLFDEGNINIKKLNNHTYAIAYNADHLEYENETTGILQTNAVCIGYLGYDDSVLFENTKDLNKVSFQKLRQKLKFYDNSKDNKEVMTINKPKTIPIDKMNSTSDTLFSDENKIIINRQLSLDQIDVFIFTDNKVGLKKFNKQSATSLSQQPPPAALEPYIKESLQASKINNLNLNELIGKMNELAEFIKNAIKNKDENEELDDIQVNNNPLLFRFNSKLIETQNIPIQKIPELSVLPINFDKPMFIFSTYGANESEV